MYPGLLGTLPAPTLCGRASIARSASLEEFTGRASCIQPYLCVRGRVDNVLGVVVPQELLLPEQRIPGLVTLRIDPSCELTLPVDDVLLEDQRMDTAEALQQALYDRGSLPHLRKVLLHDASRAGLILEAKQLQSTRGGFAGADFLHDQIAANHWGIGMAALDYFFGVVTEKWLRGDLKNTGGYSRRKFKDASIGPNMYQVCEQVITPMTADPSLMFPGVSWALRESIVGAEVFHFVSHAWAEGVFEFQRFLKQAWRSCNFPHNGKAAYICFLSNPQNLDIASMLANIHTSPFYTALQHLPTDGRLILIATENATIHLRLWCVFEAYAAMARDITVVLAGDKRNLAKHRDAVLQQEARISESASAAQVAFDRGVALGSKSAESSTLDVIKQPFLGCGMLVCTGIVLAVFWLLDWTDGQFLNNRDLLKIQILSTPLWLFGASSFCLFLLCFKLEQAEFRWRARTGSFLNVRDAQCSSPEDAERIKAFISGEEDKISAQIGRLICT